MQPPAHTPLYKPGYLRPSRRKSAMGQPCPTLAEVKKPPVITSPTLSKTLFHKLDALELEAPHTNTGHSRWMVPYADLLTLLLGLFMVLFSMSHMDNKALETNSKQLKQSLEKIKIEQANVLAKNKTLAKTTQEIVAKSRISSEEAQRLEVDLKKQMALSPTGPGGLQIRQDERGLVISLTDSMLFAPGSAELAAPARRKLDIIARTLRAAHRPIRVEGHTDNTPIATSLYPSNWELSTARATNIIRYLIQNRELRPDQLSAAGYGEFHPVAENSSIEGKRKNRRVDIVLLGAISPKQP